MFEIAALWAMRPQVNGLESAHLADGWSSVAGVDSK